MSADDSDGSPAILTKLLIADVRVIADRSGRVETGTHTDVARHLTDLPRLPKAEPDPAAGGSGVTG